MTADIVYDTTEKKRIIEKIDSVFLKGIVERKNYLEIFNKIDKYAIFICTYENREPIGYVAMYANDIDTRTAYITMLGVCREAQGQGVGSLLIERCIYEAKERGMSAIRLRVYKINGQAVAFYSHHDFVFEKECSDDCYYMILRL